MIEIAKLLGTEGITHDAKQKRSELRLTRRELSIAEKNGRIGIASTHEIGVCPDGDKKTPHNPVGVVGQKNEQLLPQKCRSGTA